MSKKDYSDLSKEELLEIIDKLESKKKYGLVWDEEKIPEKVVTDCQKQLPVLKEIKTKEIKNNVSDPIHILIEGDNYHALSVLNYTHKEKIDVIYIDPPYNTGNKDFIYNDSFVEKEDTYRHSKWLNFMSKRLEIAKNVLKETGLIFISIDDTEEAQLKIICNEIFGEGNFLANIIWQKAFSPVNLRKTFSANHDFILCYCKNIDKVNMNQLERTEKTNKNYKNYDNDPRGLWTSADLTVGPVIEEKLYEITTPSGKKYIPPAGRCWVVTKERFQELVDDNRIWFGKNKNNMPRQKKFLNEVKTTTTPLTIWLHNEVGHNQDAKKELKEILFDSASVFETPKPTTLLNRILQIGSQKKSIILDFFAGSGSLADSVLQMNKLDNGKRRFILCTNNDSNICSDVCYPRIKKIIFGYENQKNEKIPGLNGNLKYFKTSFVRNSLNKDQVKIDITKNCTEMLCIKEGIYNLYKESDDWKIFEQSGKYLAVYYEFENDSIDRLKEEMNALKGKKILYCFTIDPFGLVKERFSDWKNIRLEPIPQKILDVYKRLFKDK